MARKAQAILEFSLILIIAGALILGLLVLWAWSKQNIWDRQGGFEGLRVTAGTKASPGKPEVSWEAGLPTEPKYLNK